MFRILMTSQEVEANTAAQKLWQFGQVWQGKKKTIHKFLLKTLPHRYSPLQNLKHLHKSNKTQQTQLL